MSSLTASVPAADGHPLLIGGGAAVLLGLPVALALAVAVFTGAGAFGGGSSAGAAPVLACGPVVSGADEPLLGPVTDDQLANAATIRAVAAQLQLPERAALVATVAALTESRLHNDAGGDADSVGLFQERPSQGWGTVAQISDPAYSATAFYDRLPAGWQNQDTALVAQAVENSAHPQAYAQWEPLAARFVATEDGTAACTGSDGWSGGPGSDAPAGGTLPAGFTVPAGTPAQVLTAISFALGQLGKPYLYGGTGPGAWDCSALVQAAYAAAGITLPRTSEAQVGVGTPVYDQNQALPGDLVFIAGDDGTATAPGHVGMYLGTVDGVPLVLHAPHTGDVVRVDSLAGWPVVAIRRYTTPTSTPPTSTAPAGTASGTVPTSSGNLAVGTSS